MAAPAIQNVSATQVVPGLARVLVQAGKLTPEQSSALLKKASANNSPFIDELLAAKALTPYEVALFCATTFGHPLMDLAAVDLAVLPIDTIDPKLSISLRAVALRKRGNRLLVAIADPTNLQALDQIKFQTQMLVEPVVVEADKLARVISQLAKTTEAKLNEMAGQDLSLELVDGSPDDASNAASAADSEVDDAPIVRFLQKVLLDAINMGASDLHFEPYEKFYRIRFRVDGVLQEMSQPPLVIKEKLAARIKVISKLDISEKRVPQDGRMKLVLGPNKAIDFRVSTLPTLFGEKIVMRILDPSQAKLGIDALGYEPDQKKLLLDAVQRPYGMVLVTGPTGSGKTVSLYTCLNILNQPGVNISTAEDPAEIQLAGINQVNVNEKAGLTFAAALKSFLRQDPDIIMVGEIRDLETADISIKAAQTGHMVFSTLHTNDAPSTLTRMLNMGIAPFNIASSVILITAQRLARRLCSHCKEPYEADASVLLQAGFAESDLDGTWQPYRPVGCEHCNNSGYKGRVGIYQIMPITEEMQRIILANGNSMDIAKQAKLDGVRDLRQSGLLKVRQGMTSIEEVLGVTNE
ncbi:type IV-A pilus assembly ATPase PilB [Derxia lacustris]|uniref:type IV-A pilus assembly ATPase PilB n=1 Tax=Derxia lacustris TaxID=764842 RepID=UPI000A16CEAC|nr:type IV-A pilus assembly ATPase PilB [Derxia lacustris]